MQGSEPGSQVIRACTVALVALSACLLAGFGVVAALGPDFGRPLALPLPAPFPPVRILTLLVGLHLIGLCFGLGGATMLDFWILRWMRQGSMPAEIERSFLFISKVVTMGIALLWISGLGFLGLYAIESPEKLSNPKLLAKVTVVAALTVNGVLIHALVLPSVLRDVRRPMLDGVTRLTAAIFLVSGAVSGVSWYFAFALGLLREMNGRVEAGLLLALWGVGIVLAAIGAFALRESLTRWAKRRAPTPPMAEPTPIQAPVPPARLARIPAETLVSIRRTARQPRIPVATLVSVRPAGARRIPAATLLSIRPAEPRYAV